MKLTNRAKIDEMIENFLRIDEIPLLVSMGRTILKIKNTIETMKRF